MRGILGAGINRMNIFTVRQATEGLARFMDTQDPETKRRGVAIAYDSRHMSPEFAMEAAKTLAKHDIPSFVFESYDQHQNYLLRSATLKLCRNHDYGFSQSSCL